MHCDDVITIAGINRIAGAIDRDVVGIGSRGNLIGATMNGYDVCTITGINGIAGAIDCDVVSTAASGDMIAATERDFIVAGDKTSNGNVTSGAEVEFARRCSVDRAAGAFYLHNTAAGGIHCNRIVGREVEFAARAVKIQRYAGLAIGFDLTTINDAIGFAVIHQLPIGAVLLCYRLIIGIVVIRGRTRMQSTTRNTRRIKSITSIIFGAIICRCRIFTIAYAQMCPTLIYRKGRRSCHINHSLILILIYCTFVLYHRKSFRAIYKGMDTRKAL